MTRRTPPDFEHFAYRVIQDAWDEATARYWERRAEQLEAARPRPGDYTGAAKPTALLERHRRLTEAAAACRARAQLTDLARVELDNTITDTTGQPHQGRAQAITADGSKTFHQTFPRTVITG